MTDLDDIFEAEAERIRREAEADEANPEVRERRERKRAAEVQKQIRMGIRDADGNLIETPDDDGEEEDGDEEA